MHLILDYLADERKHSAFLPAQVVEDMQEGHLVIGNGSHPGAQMVVDCSRAQQGANKSECRQQDPRSLAKAKSMHARSCTWASVRVSAWFLWNARCSVSRYICYTVLTDHLAGVFTVDRCR